MGTARADRAAGSAVGKTTLTAALAGAAFLLGLPVPARAQDAARAGSRASATARHRRDCRLATRVLETGHPAPERAWALRIVPSCGGRAPAAVAALWRRAPADSGALDLLVAASVLTLDARTFAALTDVARDRGAPDAVRLAALRALVSYAVPGAWLSGDVVRDVLRAPGVTTPLLTPVDHPNGRVGSRPPAPGTAAAARTLFGALAGEPSPVGTLAGALRDALPQRGAPARVPDRAPAGPR